MRTILLACFAAIGCYNPSFTECTIACGGSNGLVCPSGYSCNDGYCRSSTGSCAGSGSGSDGGIMADADLSKFEYSKTVLVAGLPLSAAVTDFPVLVRTTDTQLMARAQASGNDIVFATPSASGPQPLPFEIEEFDKSTGKLVAWVRVPRLDPNVSTTFVMLYGNPSATSQMQRAGTWDSNYLAVWHLSDKDPQNATIVDSTGTHDASRSSNVLPPAVGLMAGGFTFAGTIADHFSIPTANMNHAMFTFEAWLNVTAPTTGVTTHRLLSTPITFSPYYGVEYNGPNGSGSSSVRVDPTVQNGTFTSRTVSLPPNQWRHLMVTWNSDVTQVFMNGVPSTFGPSAMSPIMDGQMMTFGGNPALSKIGPLGTIDEVRMSKSVRSQAWAQAAYELGKPGSPHVMLGPEQAAF